MPPLFVLLGLIAGFYQMPKTTDSDSCQSFDSTGASGPPRRGSLERSGITAQARPTQSVCVSRPLPYWMLLYTVNSGMYIEITMKPTIAPITMIMIGSMIEVRPFTEASTRSS